MTPLEQVTPNAAISDVRRHREGVLVDREELSCMKVDVSAVPSDSSSIQTTFLVHSVIAETANTYREERPPRYFEFPVTA